MWKLLSFFARFYTPGKFIRFIRGTGRRLHFLPKLMTIFYCMQDKDTPKFVKLALMGALGYVILPLDLVSDAFIGIGWLGPALGRNVRQAGAPGKGTPYVSLCQRVTI